MNTSPIPPPVKYKRRLRNYLLDVGLQLKYTAAIVIVAALLTAGLGYKIYDTTRDTSKVIVATMLVDPVIAAELQSQFQANDRVVLGAIVGFGLVLILSVAAIGILITHRVAGPLHKVSGILTRIRDGKLWPPIRNLRRGDELLELHKLLCDTHEALRRRMEEDTRVITDALAVIEKSGANETKLVGEMRHLLRDKEDSLKPGDHAGSEGRDAPPSEPNRTLT